MDSRAGKFLRSSRYDGAPTAPFTPGTAPGTDAPALRGGFRAAYFATHFNNFYQAAPLAEVGTYLEDLALWGTDVLILTIPIFDYTGIDDPQLVQNLTQLGGLFELAKQMDMDMASC